MNTTTCFNPCIIDAVKMNRVVFDHSDVVSLDATFRWNGELITSTLLFSFSMFNDFLRMSGQAGVLLQDAVCDQLLGNDQPPYFIELSASPMICTTCQLELHHLIAGDTSCFSVENLGPVSFLNQTMNLKNNIRDFGQQHIARRSLLRNAIHDLASLYRYYTGLMELNVTEHAARCKAGLLNEKIFKLAYYAARK
jgi:hypothetical protein